MKKSKKPYYGKTTKQKVVNEYEYTSASMKELADLYVIFGSNTVANWIKKYGKLELKQPLGTMKKPTATLSQKENRKQMHQQKKDQ